MDDNSNGGNILQSKIVLKLSPTHDSLDYPSIIGRASGCPYCNDNTPTEKNTKDGMLAGEANPGSADPISHPTSHA